MKILRTDKQMLHFDHFVQLYSAPFHLGSGQKSQSWLKCAVIIDVILECKTSGRHMFIFHIKTLIEQVLIALCGCFEQSDFGWVWLVQGVLCSIC